MALTISFSLSKHQAVISAALTIRTGVTCYSYHYRPVYFQKCYAVCSSSNTTNAYLSSRSQRLSTKFLPITRVKFEKVQELRFDARNKYGYAYYTSLSSTRDLAVFPLHLSFLRTCPQGRVSLSCLQKLKVDIFSPCARRERDREIEAKKLRYIMPLYFFLWK